MDGAVPVPVRRPLPKAKKPALRRAEAREKLNEVTEVVSLTGSSSSQHRDGADDDNEGALGAVETRSVLERECAICLSTLHAPAPPEPAKLSPETPITDAAALPASLPQSTDPSAPRPSSSDPADQTPTATTPDSETILKLLVCSHEFHADCLVSWFVLRKTSCPICRSMYMSKEALDQHDEEERIALGGDATPAALEAGTANQTPAPLPMSNWQYFLHGSGIRRQQAVEARTNAQAEAQTQAQAQPAVELQDRAPQTGEQTEDANGTVAAGPVDTAVQQPDQPFRSRWQRILRR
ncbi:uncharacterized protein J4E87_000373 [Alternaria ethzedia]|uniref:uncharacterized protein n=1 Tax=Alternaria ethzedia TaxID=181014 RepID=UPI0020C4A818|nr:uncharacterized protein J4E87_000373 [Alternaria ethzedia]KAI4635422.1 hypothetical protein J4E87_000373 [Alternaria ethzedia]